MTRFTIASFNVKNLIGPDQEYYRFQRYTPEEYAWKADWLSEQIQTLNADIIGFQEIFEENALRDVVDQANREGEEGNRAHLPGPNKRYRRKAIFSKLSYGAYGDGSLFVAPNAADTGAPGARRPGLAMLSRFGFAETPEVLQDLPEPIEIDLGGLVAGEGGTFRLSRLSRPVIKARIPVEGRVISVFNCHLKSKLGTFIRPDDAPYPPEADLTRYDPVARALGGARSALRRMVEAWVLRRWIVAEIEAGYPVMAMGDFNDGEHAVSSEIVSGEDPFRNYAWMLRHDAENPSDRYSEAEDAQIRGDIEAVKLHSAERQFVKRSARDMIYTAAFGGAYESIDQIYMSRHFLKDAPESLGEMEYFSVFNDHITDGSHAEAPYNKLASDHGQIMAHMRLID